MNKAKISWIILFLYMFILFYYSTTKDAGLLKTIPEFDFNDKVFHFFSYGILSFLTFNAFRYNKLLNEKIFFYSIMFSVIYGTLIEVNQTFIPYRDFEFLDIAADFAGSLMILFRKLF
ncbi:VanZ family protein [Candidatus Woesearchaeota archaeon]|nr:VanZ family protein [Candidatus Woesearchaeota archaeon]